MEPIKTGCLVEPCLSSSQNRNLIIWWRCILHYFIQKSKEYKILWLVICVGCWKSALLNSKNWWFHIYFDSKRWFFDFSSWTLALVSTLIKSRLFSHFFKRNEIDILNLNHTVPLQIQKANTVVYSIRVVTKKARKKTDIK